MWEILDRPTAFFGNPQSVAEDDLQNVSKLKCGFSAANNNDSDYVPKYIIETFFFYSRFTIQWFMWGNLKYVRPMCMNIH